MLSFRYHRFSGAPHEDIWIIHREAILPDGLHATGYRQISCAHTQQGLGTHIKQTQFHPHIHFILAVQSCPIAFRQLTAFLPCSVHVPAFAFRLGRWIPVLSSRGSTLIYPPFIYFYFRPIWTHISGMENLPFTYIDANVGYPRPLVGILEEHEVPGP